MQRLPRTPVRRIAAIAVIVTLVAVGSTSIGAQTAIKGGQHFLGAVNGQAGQAVVYTVCPGPTRPSQLGGLAGGQTLLVVETTSGYGFTGPFSHAYAWFVPQAGGPAPVQLTFAGYGEPLKIPTTVRVPCSGGGRVEFSSCPYNAPCAAGWVPNYVHVKFEDIAV